MKCNHYPFTMVLCDGSVFCCVCSKYIPREKYDRLKKEYWEDKK